jgi:hypothetical protein
MLILCGTKWSKSRMPHWSSIRNFTHRP